MVVLQPMAEDEFAALRAAMYANDEERMGRQ